MRAWKHRNPRARPGRLPVAAALLLLLAASAAVAAPAKITVTRGDLEYPSETKVRIRVAAEGQGVEVGSYGLRTFVPGGKAPAGFRAHGKHAFLPAAGSEGAGWFMFRDGEPADEDPAKGAVAFTLDVSKWEDGAYRLLLFADNRPAQGAYVNDTRFVRLVTRGGRAVKEESTIMSFPSPRLTDVTIEPAIVDPGQPFALVARAERTPLAEVTFQLTVPYTVGPDEVPPGFVYVPEEKKCYFGGDAQYRIRDNGPADGDPEEGRIRVTVPTTGWQPGIYHLTLMARMEDAPPELNDYRDLAVTVRPKEPRFAVTLEHDQLLAPGTHFGDFCRLADGAVLAGEWITCDGGRSWQRSGGKPIPMAHALRDGRVVGVHFHTDPVEGKPGYFSGRRIELADGGKSLTGRGVCEVHVPQATGGIGHAAVKGPLFWKSMVEMPDGALLATMYGWFEGDRAPVPGQPGSFRYRTFLARSEDGGGRWEYLSTVAYDPEIGTEGYCEPVMRRLPGGDLVCLLRTGGDNRPYHQDNPLCVSRSTDGGKTWSAPQRTGFEGVAPDLARMTDGTLACSTGRPGAYLLFSADEGRTWGDPVSLNAERYSGYTAVCEVEPGVLLVGYGAQRYLDPKTGTRSDCLRTVRVRVRRR